MVYITGDTHGDFAKFKYFYLYDGDLVIVLGDACINYYLDNRDKRLKESLKRINANFFLVRGNHEERPENIPTYHEVDMFGGKVYIEDEYPNLIFAKDGEIYNIDGKSILVIGGAYSVDKSYRILNQLQWFPSEQLDDMEMNDIFDKVKGKHFDIVLTHTCPYKFEPRETFIDGLDQSLVDKRTEMFLDNIEENIIYDKWYCGHFHTEKETGKIEFLYESIKSLNKEKTKILKDKL